MSFKESFCKVIFAIFGTLTLLKEKMMIIIITARNTATDHDQLESQFAGNGTLFDINHGQVMVLFGVCLAGVSTTIQALQSTKPIDVISQLIHLCLVISFTAIVVSVYIRPNHHRASEMAMHFGVLFGTAALMGALVTNLSVPLMLVSVAVCFIGLAIIVIFKVVLKPTS